MCKYMEIIYESVLKIRRKDVFGGIFASTVSLSIFGWLGNPHDVIRSRTGKPPKISTFATHVHATAVSVVTDPDYVQLPRVKQVYCIIPCNYRIIISRSQDLSMEME
jgi:hypothetical protein